MLNYYFSYVHVINITDKNNKISIFLFVNCYNSFLWPFGVALDHWATRTTWTCGVTYSFYVFLYCYSRTCSSEQVILFVNVQSVMSFGNRVKMYSFVYLQIKLVSFFYQQLLSKSISSSSLGSTFSINSAAEIHKGDYSISGEVLFGVELQQDTLTITVNRARGLAAANKNGLSDP